MSKPDILEASGTLSLGSLGSGTNFPHLSGLLNIGRAISAPAELVDGFDGSAASSASPPSATSLDEVGTKNKAFPKQIVGRGNVLYSLYSDSVLRTWDLETKFVRNESHISDSQISHMEMHPEAIYMTSDNSIIAWDVDTEKVKCKFTGHLAYITRHIIHAGAMYTCSADCTIRGWDINHSYHVGKGICKTIYTGHTDTITSIEVLPQQQAFCTASRDKTIRFFELIPIHSLYTPPSNTKAMDGASQSASITESKKEHVEVQHKKALWVIDNAHKGLMFGLCFHRSLLFSCGSDDYLSAWSPQNGEKKSELALSKIGLENVRVDFSVKHHDTIFFLSHDSYKIQAFNLKTMKAERTFKGHTAKVRALRCKYECLFSAGSDMTIRKWSLKNGRCLIVCRGHSEPILSLIVKHNRTYSCSEDTTIKIWPIINERNDAQYLDIEAQISRLRDLGIREANSVETIGSTVSAGTFGSTASITGGETVSDGYIVTQTGSTRHLREVKSSSDVPDMNAKQRKELLDEITNPDCTKKKKKGFVSKLFRKKGSSRPVSDMPDRSARHENDNKKVTHHTFSEMRSSETNSIEAYSNPSYVVGRMSRQVAEDFLSTYDSSVFLIRNSAMPGKLALSKFKSSSRKFCHVLILVTEDGFQLQDSIDNSLYPTLQDLVDQSIETKDYKPISQGDAKSSKHTYESLT